MGFRCVTPFDAGLECCGHKLRLRVHHSEAANGFTGDIAEPMIWLQELCGPAHLAQSKKLNEEPRNSLPAPVAQAAKELGLKA